MSVISIEQEPRWYVLRTHPRQEDRAVSNLQAWGVETFCPKLKGNGQKQRPGVPAPGSKNLFPRYIFARFELARSLHKIQFTRGVQSVVNFGDGPTPVEDEVIQLIQSRLDEDFYVRREDEFASGDKVMIKSGPLSNLVGVFERNIKAKDRVAILLTAVGYQGRVFVDKVMVQKVA